MSLEDRIPKWYLTQRMPLFPLHNVLENGDCSCGFKAGGKHPYGKHPRTKNGFHDATNDREKLEKWLETFPDCNWGIRLGKASNYCLLDIDPRHDGIASFDRLFPEGLPDTFCNSTGSDGYHIYCLFDVLFSKKVDLKDYGFPGIEFLAEGQYAVIPNSNHTLGVYTVLKELPVITIPEKVKQLLRQEIVKDEILLDLEDDVESDFSFGYEIKDGTRNVTLASLAGKLIRKGLSIPEVYQEVAKKNKDYCKEPLEDKEVRQIVRSIEQTHLRRNGESVSMNGVNGSSNSQHAPAPAPVQKRFVWKSLNFTQGLDKYGNKSADWLIQDWLLERTTGFVISPPQVFKSYFMYHMAHSVATGSPFLGKFPVHKTGAVYCMNFEDNPAIFFNRMSQIEGDIPHYDETTEEFSFPYMRHPRIYMPDYDAGMRFDLTNPEMLYAYERDVLQQIDDLIFMSIDPFYAITPADDYYIKAAYGMNVLKDWRNQYGISIMLVHHSGKSEKSRLRDGILGSQLLNAWSETTYAFLPTGSSKTKVLCERGNKSVGQMPNITIDYKIDDYRFKTILGTPKEEDAPDDFNVNMTNTMAREYKSYSDERDEWREFVTMRHVESNDLAQHFGYTRKTVDRKMSRYDIYYDFNDKRLKAREMPEIYDARMDTKDNGVNLEGMDVVGQWEGREPEE